MVLMLAPLTPHVAEELWSRLGEPGVLAFADFPTADPALLVDDTVEIPVQVNGKVRARVTVATGASEADHEAAARVPSPRWRSCWTVRRSARSSSSPVGWSTSSSADLASTQRCAISHADVRKRATLAGRSPFLVRDRRLVPSAAALPPPFLRRVRALRRAVPEVSRMAEVPSSPSREEREFWDAQFHDDPRPPPRPRARRRSCRDASSGSAHVPDGFLTRLTDRLHDWRADARFGVVVLVLVALVAGVAWYRIGIGGASAGESGAPPRAGHHDDGARAARPRPCRRVDRRPSRCTSPAR